MSEKRCTKCGIVKPASEFDTTRRYGNIYLRSHCKACSLIDGRTLWRKKHPTASPRTWYRVYFDAERGCEMKQCSRCHQALPLARYDFVNGKPRSACHECLATYDRALYWANPEKGRASSRKWAAAHPEEESARWRAWKAAHPDWLKQYTETHRKQRTNAARVKRQADPERYRKALRDWRHRNSKATRDQENRRRARKRLASRVEKVDRIAIMVRDDCVCYLCGKACDPETNNLTLDHVIPLSRGGSHTADNLRVCCRSCNSRKCAKLPDEM